MNVGPVRAALAAAAAIASLAAAGTQRPPAERPVFEEMSRAAGLDFQHVHGASPDKHLAETMGSGGLFLDYDNDGWLDVVLVDGGSLADEDIARTARHRLFRNRGNGTFEDVSERSGLRHGAYGMGACAADYDNDGYTDLYVTAAGPNTLYRNTGGASFADVTDRARVGDVRWSTSCAFTDIDRDGDLDLFVTTYVDASPTNNPFCGDPGRGERVYCHPLNYQSQPNVLYRNDGDGAFTDISVPSGLAAHPGNGLGVVVGDYDDDGWPDVFVANDAVPDFLFHNEKGTVLREVGLLAGVSVSASGKPQAGMGTDFGDYDGDGRLDLIVTNHEFETDSLFRNLGDGFFADATTQSGLGPPTMPFVGFGVAFLDYDNDTHLDLAVANGHVIDNTALFRAGSTHGQRNVLFRNRGDGRFAPVGETSGSGWAIEKVSRALAVGDIDNDGDLDLLVTNNGQRADLLRNDGGKSPGAALLIRLVGRQSNRDGIGARLRITTGARTQYRHVKAGSSYLGQNDLRVHVGLGPAMIVDRLEIDWPAGGTDRLEGMPANHVITVAEGEGEVRRVPFTR